MPIESIYPVCKIGKIIMTSHSSYWMPYLIYLLSCEQYHHLSTCTIPKPDAPRCSPSLILPSCLWSATGSYQFLYLNIIQWHLCLNSFYAFIFCLHNCGFLTLAADHVMFLKLIQFFSLTLKNPVVIPHEVHTPLPGNSLQHFALSHLFNHLISCHSSLAAYAFTALLP